MMLLWLLFFNDNVLLGVITLSSGLVVFHRFSKVLSLVEVNYVGDL